MLQKRHLRRPVSGRLIVTRTPGKMRHLGNQKRREENPAEVNGTFKRPSLPRFHPAADRWPGMVLFPLTLALESWDFLMKLLW